MPRNYQVPKPTQLYGEANAVTIAHFGRQKLQQALSSLGVSMYAQWTHMGTDIESLWDDGSIKNAVAMFVGKLRHPTGSVRELVVPVPIRNGVILEPSVFKSSNMADVFTKEALERLFVGDRYPSPVPDRDYLYAPPPAPGFANPSKVQLAPYRNNK